VTLGTNCNSWNVPRTLKSSNGKPRALPYYKFEPDGLTCEVNIPLSTLQEK
jgi:hypothetical protein